MNSTLASSVVSGVKWLFVTKVVTQLFSWTATILIIRLLSPDDYGLMALATSFIVILGAASELGLLEALIHKDEVTRNDERAVFTLLLGLNCLIYVILYLVSPLVGAFFDNQTLVDVLRVISLQFIVGTFLIIPDAHIRKQLRFKFLMIAAMACRLLSVALSLVLAYRGHGVWALVYGNLSYFTMLAIVFNVARPSSYVPRFSFQEVSGLIRFGGVVTVEKILGSLYTNADTFIIGRVLGTTTLGFYNVALNLASIPISKLFGDLNTVAFPSFASIKNDVALVTTYYYKATRLIAALFVPMFCGISVVAEEIIAVFLGEAWRDATLPLQLLSVILPFRQLAQVSFPMVLALGMPAQNLINTTIALVILPPAILIGTQWGLLGIGVAWIIAYAFIFAIVQVRVLRLLGASLFDYLGNILPTLLCSAGMYGAVLLAKGLISTETDNISRLVIAVSVGLIAYGLLTVAFNRDTTVEAVRLLRQ